MKLTTGARIKKLRERRNWTQIELCEKVGINNSVLSRIEAGKRTVEVELLVKFADTFNVTTDYLSGRTNDSHKLLSEGARQFIDSIELEDEEALNKLRTLLLHKGSELSDDALKEILSFARYKVSQGDH